MSSFITVGSGIAIGLVQISLLVGFNIYFAKKKSRNPYVWGVLAVALPVISHYLVYTLPSGTYGWPNAKEYLARYPQCNTGQGISCHSCGSKSIRGWGLKGPGDGVRHQCCNNCGIGLFHT